MKAYNIQVREIILSNIEKGIANNEKDAISFHLGLIRSYIQVRVKKAIELEKTIAFLEHLNPIHNIPEIRKRIKSLDFLKNVIKIAFNDYQAIKEMN